MIVFSKFQVVGLIFLFSSATLSAQVNTPSEWEETEQDNATDEKVDEKDWSSRLEDLAYIKDNPFNLNKILKEQLELFPFLTDQQIEHLLYYIYVYGPMKTIFELQLVEDWDRQTIQYILPYVYVGESEKKKIAFNWNNCWKYGKHESVCRFDIPFYRKCGYQHPTDNLLTTKDSKNYFGSPYSTSLRYRFHYNDYLTFGFTASKDAGEPFFQKGNHNGFDSYSFYFLLHNIGIIKTLALGNYRLNFGKGLVINSDYSLGKSVSIATMESKSSGIKRHSSTDEYNFFRGFASTIQLKNLELTAFYSNRNLDGIVVDGVLTSIKKDGLHRLPIDFERKKATVIQSIGGHISYSFNRLKIGVTAINYFFDKFYLPEQRPYNYYNLKGKSFYNVSTDYRFRWHKIGLSGELAYGKGGGIATLNTFGFSPISGYQLLFLHRYYAKDYRAMYARSVSEGSTVQNENGTYLGIEAKPIKYWKLFAYADFFHFPWLRFGINSPSNGFDGLTQITYTPKTNLCITLTYRYKLKEKDVTIDVNKNREVNSLIQQKLKYQFGYLMNENLSLKTTLYWTWESLRLMGTEHGFLLLQGISYHFNKLPLYIDSYYGMFDTSSFSTRISCYEKGLLYALSVPSFYGKGVRFSLNIRYNFNKKMMIMVKVGQTRYTDRDKIGTSLEAINGNVKTDMNILFRCKF